MAYLSLLDQIERAVRRSKLTQGQRTRCQCGGTNKKPFRATLVQFTDLGEKRITALYALRCSYSHFFGLVNENRDQRLRHRFVLRADHGDLVRFPSTPWDGNYPAHGRRVSKSGLVGTRIDLWTLADTVESAVADLRSRHANGEIERGQAAATKPPPTDDEFQDRFTIGISP
jgi:hypothetical protein